MWAASYWTPTYWCAGYWSHATVSVLGLVRRTAMIRAGARNIWRFI